MNEKQRKRREVLRQAAVVLLGLLAVVFLFLFLSKWEGKRGFFSESEQNSYTNVRYGGKKYSLRKDVETLLVIGVDKYAADTDDSGFNNDQQNDFLMLLILDRKARTVCALHINRDTMTEVPTLGVAGQYAGSVKEQIALAHTYGSGGKDSCRNTADAVSVLLHQVPITHYMAITMDAVKIVNDGVGGVTLTVMDDLTGIDESLVKGREVTLMGDQALHYTRARMSVVDHPTNLRRMERQSQYLEALYDKLQLKLGTEKDFFSHLYLELADYTLTDCTSNQLETAFDYAGKFSFLGIRSIEGEAKPGDQYIEFYPDEDKLQEMILDLFYEEKN